MVVRIEENEWKVISGTGMAMDNTCHQGWWLKEEGDGCMAMLGPRVGGEGELMT